MVRKVCEILKMCLWNLTSGIYETPPKLGVLLNDSGFLNFTASGFKEFIQSVFWLFEGAKLLINIAFDSPSLQNAILLKALKLTRFKKGISHYWAHPVMM